MPSVVKEGRRVVNNLERSGSLFLVKNIFSLFLSILAICFSNIYPLKPAQISLVSMFTIGLPAFLLSQAPNTNLIKGKFIKNIISKALPAGLVDTSVVVVMVVLGKIFKIDISEISTACTILLSVVGLIIVYNVSKPITKYKCLILMLCLLCLIISSIFLKDIFSITKMSTSLSLMCVVFSIIIGWGLNRTYE